jgi:hypothetical protein
MRPFSRAGPKPKLVAHERTKGSLYRLRELWRILANDFMTWLPPALKVYIDQRAPAPLSSKIDTPNINITCHTIDI